MAFIAKDYWDKRYAIGRTSGYGSYDIQLTKKLNWLKGLPIKTITEIGCGDFNFGRYLMELYPKATYTGQDISEVIIKRNNKLYPYKFTNDMPLPGADLTLCIDVLFHVLDDVDYEVLLLNLKQALRWGKYLALTAYEKEQIASPHLKIRKFSPSYFGKPLIRKIVEEDGKMYFYLYARP